jgi:hypothetical protein
MHFLPLQRLLPAESAKDLYTFWLRAFAYRRGHLHLQTELAHFVFLASNNARGYLRFDDMMNDIVFEFAALESLAGSEKVIHEAWTVLESTVNKEFVRLYS